MPESLLLFFLLVIVIIVVVIIIIIIIIVVVVGISIIFDVKYSCVYIQVDIYVCRIRCRPRDSQTFGPRDTSRWAFRWR